MKSLNPHDITLLETIISKATETVIVTHMKPDGDAIGSSTALYHFLKKAGKEKVQIVINDPAPRTLDFLVGTIPQHDLIICSCDSMAASAAIAGADTIFCLDFNAFHRTDLLGPMLESANAQKVLIDHHLYPDTESFDLIFSETEISSASELLYHILMALSTVGENAESLPKETATALLTGMTTDTNNFANSVYPSTLIMTSKLLAAGTDRDYILDRLFNQHSESRLRLMGHMMKDLLTITEDGVAYIVLDKKTQVEYNVQEGDTEGFVNMPLSIASVRMSLLLKEDEDRIRVSIRSRKGTSANACARAYFNGGGHECAAGGRLHIPINEATAYIEHYTHLYFTENGIGSCNCGRCCHTVA